MHGLISLILIVLAIVGVWKTFEKAGQPGWGAIIPFYNLYLLVRIAGQPGWWFFLFFIPIVNIVAAIVIAYGVANNFGKGVGFAIGLLLLPFIFYPILGLGGAQYVAGGGGEQAPAAVDA